MSTSQPGIPKIVAIDEDRQRLGVINFILLEEDVTCELSTFESPLEAMKFLNSQPVDLIMLNLEATGSPIGGGGGLELYTEIRRSEFHADTPVIFLVSNSDHKAQMEAFEHGAADVIGKPLQAPVMSARVRRILQSQRLQKELLARNAELEHIDRRLDEFLSVVSHDLLSPLASIDILCQLIADSLATGNSGEKSKNSPESLVARVMNQSQFARRMARNIVDLHRIDKGVLVSAPTFFNIRSLLLACTEDEKAILQAKQIQFELTLPEWEIIGFGDRELISHALKNLLGNAIKFAESKIAVSARAVQESGESSYSPGTLEITVTDDGPAIPDGDRLQVFEKHAMSDRSTGGNGLGLYIARKMAELHDGTISVETSESGGSSFRIRLPLVFDVSVFPDLTEIAEARVHVISPTKSSAQMLEGVLVEGGMVNVSIAVANRVDAGDTAWDDLHMIIVDLQGSELNVVSLLRVLNDGQYSVPWVLLATEEDFKSVDQLISQPVLRLTAPLNPLQLLHLVNDQLQSGETARKAGSDGKHVNAPG